MSASWIVLGDARYGISYGPFSKADAQAFAAQGFGRIAVSLDGARSQIETCVSYGLDFKPLAAASSAENNEGR